MHYCQEICSLSCVTWVVYKVHTHIPVRKKRMVVCKFIQVDDICNTETCLDENNKKAHNMFFLYKVSKFGGKQLGAYMY